MEPSCIQYSVSTHDLQIPQTKARAF